MGSSSDWIMSEDQICKKITKIFEIMGKIETPDSNFTYDIDLFDYGYLDSFGIVELLLEIDRTFGVDLSYEDFYQNLRSVKSISANIYEKLKQNGS